VIDRAHLREALLEGAAVLASRRAVRVLQRAEDRQDRLLGHGFLGGLAVVW